MSQARRINAPKETRVEVGPEGTPLGLGGTAIESIREEWVIEDRWWTEGPLHRHYYELALADGRNVTVFRDVRAARWYRHSA
ncbi:MAG TPA: hypothetical protein VGH58_01230 [Solirubrobacterales bacterium]|jgi:hypothetical protein